MTAPLPAGVLPRGVRGRAHLLAEAAVALLGQLQPGRWGFDPALLDAHLVLPHVVAVANGLAGPPAPGAPVAAAGGGWVAVDLGPDDAATWATLCQVLAEERAAGSAPPDAEELARRAQEWRLAVTPYRAVEGGHRDARTRDHDVLELAAALVGAGAPEAAPDRPGPPGSPPDPSGLAGPTAGDGPLHGVRIVDLTAVWAGPLATWLAADLGAEVIKVEAPFRPDGLRRGERPAAAGPGPGALFVALDQRKSHVELDLSHPDGLDAFLALVDGADIVIDSFSPRVRPNLGIDPARLAAQRPGLIDLSITAFEPGRPEANWVAYGSGIHASSGLGVQLDGAGGLRGVPAVVAYPDPLCGLGALVVMLAALLARRHGGAPATASEQPWRFALSLAGAVAPLARPAGPGRDHDPAALHRWLVQAAERTVPVAGCRVLPSPLYGSCPRPRADHPAQEESA